MTPQNASQLNEPVCSEYLMEELPVGSLLKDKRASLEVSLEQVAKDTNIPLDYLEALEKEEFERIPGEGYVKGFLRTYCDYLELDADPLVDLYSERYGNGTGPKLPFVGARTRTSGNSMARFRWHLLPTTPGQRRENIVIWLIISVTLLAMWLLYYYLVIGNTAT